MPEAITPRAEDTFIRGYRQLALETPARPRDFVLRALDVLLSSIFLLLALPVALPITLIVLLTSGRPVFYRGERVGRGGRVFTMLKFRTLRADAETRLGPYLGEELARDLPAYWQRLIVRPGLTGLAQVRRGYETSMAEKLAHDLEWIADRSDRARHERAAGALPGGPRGAWGPRVHDAEVPNTPQRRRVAARAVPR